MKRLILLLLTVVFAAPLFAAEVEGVRLWTAPDHTRLVFDTSAPAAHKVFALKKPDRLVIDLAKTALAAGFEPDKSLKDKHLAGLRHAVKPDGSLRVVLDLNQAVRPKTFVLKPNASYGHRLVVDLYPVEATRKPRVAKTTQDIKRARDVVVAIDAGHGGEDPGASSSQYRTKEKTVTLEIAKRLKRLVDAQPGMRGVLTRTGDYYIGLRQRINKARKYGADMFISIHADAFHDRRAHGSSVFVLSRRGASSEMARWLARKENAADLAGGVSLDDKDDVLAEVLLDLSQTATIEASVDVADNILGEMKRLGKTHKSTVQQAGFMVLKSPDIPSVLVETAFISNPTEEKRLRSSAHQEKLARAMLKGIRTYFASHPPPGTVLAAREHVIKRGDTLGHIAQRYQVSLNSLRGFNSLKNDTLRIGETLRIPPSGS